MIRSLPASLPPAPPSGPSGTSGRARALQGTVGLRARFLACAAALGFLLGANAQAGPMVRAVADLADEARPAGAPRMLVDGPRVLAVGWTVESGPREGVYLRRRSGLEWEPAPIPLPGETGGTPRDVALAAGPGGGVHVAWTAMRGERRRPWFATLDAAGLAVSGPFALEEDAPADADFPSILPAPDGTALLLWQSGSTTHFTIESARIAASATGSESRWERLPAVSGASLSALSPQPLRDEPPTVAFYEVLDAGNRMRVALLDEALGAWRSAAWPGLGGDASIPFSRRPALAVERGSVAAPFVFHAGESPDGSGEIRIARGFEDPAAEFAIPVRGEARQPHAAVASPDARTVAFQRFENGAEAILVMRLEDVPTRAPLEPVDSGAPEDDAPATSILSVSVTSPETRVASDPFHASYGQWTAAVWREEPAAGVSPGANGPGIGFAEIYWNVPDTIFEPRLSTVAVDRP